MSPFHIEGPAVVNFSGGRTSAYMLRRILDAHDGKLPDDVIVCFANTGKERNETLDFVQRCSDEWAVPVNWLEYRDDDEKNYAVVDYDTASRKGEPFEALLRKRKFLPNPVARFCTQELKIRTTKKFVVDRLCWDRWTSLVGIRYDEPRRIAKARLANESGKERWETVLPLAKSGVVKDEVDAYWRQSTFDLGLNDGQGNCDLCFLKGRDKILKLIRERPESADWWEQMEASAEDGGVATVAGSLFRADRPSYKSLKVIAANECHQGRLGFDDTIGDCFCGVE